MVCCLLRDIDMAEFLADDEEVRAAHTHTMYDLIANICHDGQPGGFYKCSQCVGLIYTVYVFSGKGTYRVHVRHKVSCNNGWTCLCDSGCGM